MRGRAPIGLKSAECEGPPLAHRMRGSAGLCSCVYGAQTKSDDQTKYEKSLFFYHTSVKAILLVFFFRNILLKVYDSSII
jgi:hypothetical protein